MIKPIRSALRAALLATFLLPIACTAADDPPVTYKAGVHYKQTRNVALVPPKHDKVLVEEVFWYGCPHCFAFDPHVERWKKSLPEGVEFRRTPSSLGRPSGMTHSRAFYSAQVLGIEDEIHHSMFNAIHGQGRQMLTEAELVGLFEAHGIDREKFLATFNGFAVDNLVRKAESRIRSYGISSVPSVVVNGRHWTNGRYAGDFDKVLKVTDFLIEKERKRGG